MKEMPKWLKRTLIIAACVILFIAIAAGTVFAIAYSILNKIPKVDEETLEWIPPDQEFFDTDEDIDLISPPETDEEGNTLPPETDENGEVVTTEPVTMAPEKKPEEVIIETVDPIDSKGLINILLVGQDKRPGQGRQRSDTMILCSINTKTKEMSIISFLRDLYVKIPGGYSDNRLNLAYMYGGFKLLNEALNTNFGVKADYNLEVDFTAFEKIIDKIGGITIELTEKEANYMGGGLTAGENRLNGEQALAYARIRKIGSDFGRTERQRKVLLSIMEEAKTKPVDEIFKLINEICPLLTTDMSNAEILGLATKLVPMLTSMKVNTYHVPPSGTYYAATIRKMQVLVPDTQKIRKLLANEYLPFG